MAVVLGTNSGFVSVAPAADPGGSGRGIDNYSSVTCDTSPADATKITEIGWWCDAATEAANFEVGLYDSDGIVVPGEAATRLFVDAVNAKGLDAGWKRVAVDWAITGSHKYWIGMSCENTATASYTNYNSSGGAGYDQRSGVSTLNNPFGGGALSDVDGLLTIYALYTTGGVQSIVPLLGGTLGGNCNPMMG